MKMSSRFLVLLLAAGTGLRADSYVINDFLSKCGTKSSNQLCYKQDVQHCSCKGAFQRANQFTMHVGDTFTVNPGGNSGTQELLGLMTNVLVDNDYFRLVESKDNHSNNNNNNRVGTRRKPITYKAIKPTSGTNRTVVTIERAKKIPTVFQFKIVDNKK